MTDYPYPFRFKLYQSLADYTTEELEAELRRREAARAWSVLANEIEEKHGTSS